MEWRFFGISRTRVKRLLQGVVLGLGAPAGWAIISALGELTPQHPQYLFWLFTYMTFGTISIFAVFGFIIGRHEQRFAELSFIDSLTSLYNTRFFHMRFRQELSRSARQHQPLALLIGDIDFFKRVNDTYGHQAGDEVLCQVAALLVSSVRDADVVARVGGEEFAVIVPATNNAGAMALAERMRQNVKDASIWLDDSRSIRVTMSFGISVYNGKDPIAEPDMMYGVADRALYRAKANGRDRVEMGRKDDEGGAATPGPERGETETGEGGLSGVPARPASFGAPGTPGTPGTPDMPEVSGTPGTSGINAPTDVSGASDTPGMPGGKTHVTGVSHIAGPRPAKRYKV